MKNKKEKPTSKIKNIIIIILSIITLFLLGYIIYTDFIVDEKTTIENNDKKNQTTEEIKISQVTQNEIKTILGITPGEEEISLYGFYEIILKGKGVINELPAISKSKLIIEYGIKNQEYTKVTGEEYEYCSAGAGFCYGFSEENYQNIASKYGITDDSSTIFESAGYQLHNGLYVGFPTGTTISGTIKHDLIYTYSDQDIKVIDNYTFTDNDAFVDTKTKTYIFKNKGINYYLYSIN